MQITAKTEYALRAMVELASCEGETSTAAEIAARQGIPEKILPGIVRSLATAGLVETARGFGGGVRLAQPPEAVSVRDVWEALEGPLELSRCAAAGSNCPIGLGERCPLQGLWERTRARMLEEWSSTTLRDLARRKRTGRRTHHQTRRRRTRALAAV